jgi:peptidyl-prolyl cis-trans isomerase A (cyclophilin A)
LNRRSVIGGNVAGTPPGDVRRGLPEGKGVEEQGPVVRPSGCAIDAEVGSPSAESGLAGPSLESTQYSQGDLLMSIPNQSRWAVLALAGLAAFSGPAWADKVRLATSMGDIVIELDAQKAPKSVANFEQYVKEGHYDGTVFHRVIDNFMIQGGGMLPNLREKPTRKPIALESHNGLKNAKYSVAMARTDDPNSATSQFFINLKDNGFLDSANSPDGNGYAVFGRVVAGTDVVDKIKQVATATKGPYENVPVTAVVINKATLEQ